MALTKNVYRHKGVKSIEVNQHNPQTRIDELTWIIINAANFEKREASTIEPEIDPVGRHVVRGTTIAGARYTNDSELTFPSSHIIENYGEELAAMVAVVDMSKKDGCRDLCRQEYLRR